jgi:hypothetical protein
MIICDWTGDESDLGREVVDAGIGRVMLALQKYFFAALGIECGDVAKASEE